MDREKSIIDVRSFIEKFSLKLSDYFGEDVLKIESKNFRNVVVTTNIDEITSVLFECCYFIIKYQDDRHITLFLESNRGMVSFIFNLEKSFAEHRALFEKIFYGFEEKREFIEDEEFFKIKITISDKKRQIKSMFVSSGDDARWSYYAKRLADKIDEWILAGMNKAD